MHQARAMDRWLKWVAILGPFFGFMMGNCSGAWATYIAFKADSQKIVLLEGWKDKQEDFNRETIAGIAALKEIVKRIR